MFQAVLSYYFARFSIHMRMAINQFTVKDALISVQNAFYWRNRELSECIIQYNKVTSD